MRNTYSKINVHFKTVTCTCKFLFEEGAPLPGYIRSNTTYYFLYQMILLLELREMQLYMFCFQHNNTSKLS